MQRLSGTPGYLDSHPIRIGHLEDDNKDVGAPIQMWQEGFIVKGSSITGECVRKPVEFSDYNDPVVNFKQDLTYGCAVPYNKASLKSLCESKKIEGKDANTWIQGYEIFSNLIEFSNYGKFGNANMHNAKDWTPVKEDPSYAKLGDVEWFENNQTCKLYSSVLIKIIYGKTGFMENPQQYIAGIEKHAIVEEWTYPTYNSDNSDGSKQVDFNHYVTFQHVNLDQAQEDEFGYLTQQTLFSFSKMMFYPAFIRSMASAKVIQYSIASILGLGYVITN